MHVSRTNVFMDSDIKCLKTFTKLNTKHADLITSLKYANLKLLSICNYDEAVVEIDVFIFHAAYPFANI